MENERGKNDEDLFFFDPAGLSGSVDGRVDGPQVHFLQ
jgi:hypothetical protein